MATTTKAVTIKKTTPGLTFNTSSTGLSGMPSGVTIGTPKAVTITPTTKGLIQPTGLVTSKGQPVAVPNIGKAPAVNINQAYKSGGLSGGSSNKTTVSSQFPTALSAGQFGGSTSPSSLSTSTTGTNNVGTGGTSVPGTAVINAPAVMGANNTKFTFPEPTVTDYSNSIPASIQPSATDTTKKKDNALVDYLKSLDDNRGDSADAYRKAQRETDILAKQQAVNDLTGQLNAIVNKGQANQLSLVGQGRGIPEAIIGGQQAQIGRETAIAALPIQAQLSAAQGNLEMANDNLDTLFKIYSDDARNEFEARREQKKMVYEIASAKEKRELDKLDKLEERAYQETESIRKEVRDYAKLAMANGQADLSARISSLAREAGSPTFDADMQALVRKIKDPVQTAQLQKLNLEISQLNNASAVGEGNANLTAYASQYADSGKLPSPAELKMSGLSVGQVTEMAKQIPRGKGFVVSNVTGTKSNSVTAEAEKDFQKLYNITEMTKRLKELDKKRIGGLIGGGLGKVFGSEAQGEYLTLRKAIVDEMSRMQSGAALTPDEIAVYNDYLPGRASEALFLGQDSLKKIQNFETAMNQKLENRLSNNGLSIYGYSKVPVGNTLRTVGEIIDIGGVNYRVLPDGSLTDIL